MRPLSTKRLLVGISLLVGILAAGGVAVAAATRPRHRGLSLGQVQSAQASSPTRVIVLLRNQHTNLPPTRARISARHSAVQQDQIALQASVRNSGGRVLHTYSSVNAFAAAVSKTEQAKLAANSAVAQVLPDTFVRRPNPVLAGGVRRLGPRSATPSTPNARQPICPANPDNPIVEPEALSIIHADQAQSLASGQGVKVAFVAEGIDTNNPDFIRPDGSHVFVDYQDFSGEGPNAPTSGGEAFGDASSIAAQGTVKHDLSTFVNPAHPLPPGCNVVLRGVSPGASLVGIKVFGQAAGAFTSVILQGLDYAVSHDHVDVLNESFGSDPLPDTTQDVIKQFNSLATAAGTTVTISSGDQGTTNTIGSPANNPDTIDVGATTQFRHMGQTTRGGYQLGGGGWVNENIAEFSSSGFTQTGATLDLVAPGNESYETCTADVTLYSDCHGFGGQPSNITSFGGTSESAPLTAGVAALVIQAYRNTHGGASPSPGLIKQLILSNANDLNIPSNEQGAGELDALAAVKAAQSYGKHARIGNGRLVDPTQLDLATPAGSGTGADVTVSNDGAGPQTYRATLRSLTTTVGHQHGSVTLDPSSDPTFINERGVPQGYQKITFHVPAGVDRFDASIAFPGPANTVNLTLFDPQGRMTAFTYEPPGGFFDYDHISVRNPQAGTWTAAFFTPADGSGFTGAVQYDFTYSQFGSAGNVSPSSFTLAPGASRSVHVSLAAPAPGDYTRDLQLSDGSGKTSVIPVVLRSLVPLQGGAGEFSGTITGGNGNGTIGREDTFAFDVPRGAPAVSVSFRVPNDPNTQILGYLVSPDGQALGQQASVEHTAGELTMDVYRHAPQAGRWRFVIATLNPVGGTTISARFIGTVSLAAPRVSAVGVPNDPHAVIPSGQTVTAKVRISNPGRTDMNVFIDPRRSGRTFYSLLSLKPSTGVALPIPGNQTPPQWIVPTQTNLLLAAAHGSASITFEWGFGDPDLEGRSFGNDAAGAFAAQEVTPGIWFMAPALIGPFDGPASGTVDAGLVAYARAFDTSITSPPGDPQLADVDPNAPAATPAVVHPGQTVTIPVTIAASGRRGSLVTGELFVDDSPALGTVNEVTAIPYAYRVG